MQSPGAQFRFRFDKERDSQSAMMRDIYSALQRRKSIFINAPTGIGKTDASISAALAYAMDENLGVFFLTPKISQHKIAIDVLSGLRKKFGMNIKYIDLVGKRNMCVNPNLNLMEGEAFYKSCEHLMKNKRCLFYENAKKMEVPDAMLEEVGMTGHNALFRESFDRGVCAYEISAKIAKDANFIIADYAHILNPSIMDAFLRKIEHSMKDSIFIWDEAHNVMNMATSYMSTSLTTQSIRRASEELSAIKSSIDLGYLDYMLSAISKSKIKGDRIEEAFVERKDIPELLTQNTEVICKQLEAAAMEYINAKGAKRSSLMHISRFVRAVASYDESDAVIISRYGKGAKLSVSCLYPADAMASLKQAYANIFMSGTLLPIDMHKEMLGFPDADSASYPMPFPKENRMCVLDKDVSTRYVQRTPYQYRYIADKISMAMERAHGNIAVFFPSFGVLKEVIRHMKYEVKFVQQERMRSLQVENMLKEFKGGDNNVLFAVMGGSLSEGIDYENNIIKGIIIVGVPLEKPNLELRARIEYFNKRFNMKGTEYAYIIPGVVKAVQAAGRAIRGENDRAFVLFMDRRYSWSTYKSIISDFMHIDDDSDYLPRIAEFMGKTIKAT